MLAAHHGDRFLLFPEQEFINLGIPFAIRRSTNDVMLAELAKMPLKPIQMPELPGRVSSYLEWVEMFRRSSKTHENRLSKNYSRAKKLYRQQEEKHSSDPPLNEEDAEFLKLALFDEQRIKYYFERAAELWNGLTEEDRKYLAAPPGRFTWACSYPLDAGWPFLHWAPNEPPQRVRQLELLTWAVENEGAA
ncbi:hypothetical protein DM806_20225 [Sphingobium lactosutens]|mgnify:FL=1|nr:hypothetical protein [Sphingobium lactosutens]